MKKLYALAVMLCLVKFDAFGAAEEGINLSNYKDFEGRSAYAILGARTKNSDGLGEYGRLAQVLNPRNHVGTEHEQSAREAFDLMRQAYFKIHAPGPSRDYQIRLADREGHAWKEDRYRRPYVAPPYYSYEPHFDEGDWVYLQEISTALESQMVREIGNSARYIQLLARAVLDLRKAILDLQQQSQVAKDAPSGGHQRPELETAH